MRREGELCDAILRTSDGQQFMVHRAIMSACSPYFRTLFTTTLHAKERHDIIIPGISSDMLCLIIEYAYTRTIDVSWENVEEILSSGDQFNVMGIVKCCSDFLILNLRPENCIGIRQLARRFYIPDLEDKAHKYLMVNFPDVTNVSEELMELSVEELVSICGDEELNVRNEETVWVALIKWIDQKPQERKKHIVQLMRCVRLGLLDTQFFIEKVKNHRYVLENEDCRPLVIDTLKFLYDLEMITEKDGEIPTPDLARPRIPYEVMFAIGGWSGGSPTNFIETYDTRADRWVKVDEVDPMGARAYHKCAVINFDIYVIGGFDGVEYFNSCRCFNAVTKEWREVAPMNARRCYVSVTVLNDIIYAMGGYNGHHRQNTVEKYDYTYNQWSMITPMNVQRSDACATVLNGIIFITGGFNGTECMNSAECYNPKTDQWNMLSPMRNRRSGVSCFAYHDHIYVLGGFNGITRLCSGEKYNPATDTWTPIPDMYNPRSNFGIEVIDDMLFAIGGFNGVTTIFHVECYDEKTNEWYEATDMNIFRSALAACVVSGLPNVYDYVHKHRDRLMEEKRQKLLELQQNQANDTLQPMNNN
ncbi:kelch-like protein 10 [Tachypleus tridentatus]|uniref:kelch-like protein 10 n=1 Tax=Tachypleus tridentatus TaxID=6853 RepID=UPI003FCF8C98